LIETTIRLPSARVESLLDDLLPLVPGGVHHREGIEEGLDELIVFDTAGGPDPDELRRLAGDDAMEVAVAEVPGGPAERRLRLYRPLLVGPVWIRPAWAPAAPDHALEVVLGEGSGFGSGAHPTTRGCIEILLGLQPGGSFADLGCGSGILSIVAAKLGWSPVVAVDVSASAVDTAAANAEASRAGIGCTRVDLIAEPAPIARTTVANVPAVVHRAIAASLVAQAAAGAEPPAVLIASGIPRSDRAGVTGAYSPLGLEEAAVGGSHEWAIIELRAREAG
jgi:ribosomal protein L11 methyltransferase